MTDSKKDILIIMGRYLPGYKDGGPVRSIKNLVDYLGDEYNFKILTCDRDHGDIEPYPNIKVNNWNEVGNAQVYYVPPKGFKLKLIKRLSNEVDLIYCCGCFNDYAINTLILNRFNMIKVPVVVAAMGLFSPMEFRLKYLKKKTFTTIFNLMGVFKKIYWSATSEMEVSHIRNQVNLGSNYFIAEDLPRKVEFRTIVKKKEVGKLKVVWLSRIAPVKNLKGAIEIIKNTIGDIEFTIYGPIHNKEYWSECLEELNKLPKNVKWSYKGSVQSEQVVKIFEKHHVFLFTTLGENYGHVIQEALSAGCPAIISDQTPWNNLEKNNAGYVISLNKKDEFIQVLENYVAMDISKFQKNINQTLNYIIENNQSKVKNNGYTEIFKSLTFK